MLQTINPSSYAGWPGASVSPVVSNHDTWKQGVRSSQSTDLRPRQFGDVTLLYPEAVVVSSDAYAWQDVRVIHLRHRLNELVVPPSDNHCLVLNLSAPLQLNARLGKSDFAGNVRTACCENADIKIRGRQFRF